MTDCDTGIMRDVAAVVIGRNEGERLRLTLRSLAGKVGRIVYVDSGSTDGSVEHAKTAGAQVVDLDLGRPFTAARARNAGFREIVQAGDGAAFVQFVDGDCEIEPGWLEVARRYLSEHPRAAVVFGRRRERYPDRSIYNRLCDLEWTVPAGEAKSCGGDAMIRTDSLQKAGGYRADLIAGEEPELCVRLRADGWTVTCLDHPMTRHDAAITRFSQWWRRATRAGYAFAQGTHLHGAPPERHWTRESRRAWAWGLGLPVATALAASIAGPPGLLLAAAYPAQVVRLYFKRRTSTPEPLASAFFDVIGKFPECLGQLKFTRDRLTGRTGALIEYK
jgi:GT2 family glycosyltransferase